MGHFFEVFKCATSNGYYSKIEFQSVKLTSFNLVSRICSEDPTNYQSCGLFTKSSIINSYAVCNEVICQIDEKKNSSRSYNITYINILQNECFFDIAHSKFLDIPCKPHLDIIECEDNDLSNVKECDMVCLQNPNDCPDEAICNGLIYGLFCLYNGKKRHVKPSKICNGIMDCDDQLDEIFCVTEEFREGPNLCVPANGFGFYVPIKNNTRCGPLEVSSYGKKYSYCLGFMDQVNCSDPRRGVLTCDISGYPSTVSVAVVCMEDLTLCDDGLESQCTKTSLSCFIHKHLLCDGVEDCEDASDEHVSQCNRLLETKCDRKLV